MSHRSSRPYVIATVVLLLALGATPLLAGFEERRSLAASELKISNLIGTVTVTGHSGSQFEVVVRIEGRDGTPDQVRVETTTGDSADLKVVFPSAKRFVYPRLGAGSRSTFSRRDSADGGSWLSALFGGSEGEVTVAGSGSGLEMWADIEVQVPVGTRLVVRHGVGELSARQVEAALDLATRAGQASARSIRGDVRIDTGSGQVEVEEVEGDLLVDTGSGRVMARGVRSDEISIDTGSGQVEIDGADAKRILIDTGSGRVEAEKIGADSLKVDTGSGGIDLELERMGTGSFRLDTGSGGIRLAVPRGASLQGEADTGSGGIEIDLEGAIIERRDRDEARFTLGGGAARVSLDTGSGGIRVRYSD